MSLTHVPAELRRLVRERANRRCEYCLISEINTFAVHEIDHIVAEKHGGKTSLENLALSCTLCNRRKGSDLSSIDPKSGELVPLFHPRKDRWEDHFCFNGAHMDALTATGRATVQMLGLNAEMRLAERGATIFQDRKRE
jgi:hypothetical protein